MYECLISAVFLLMLLCLKIRLQECLQERAELLQAHEAANRQREKEKMEYKRAREAWERRRRELESEISRLQRELNHNFKQIQDMERKQEVMYQQPAPIENPHKAKKSPQYVC